MKLIVGLGNPGLAYAHTRHNIGFSVVKALSSKRKAPLKREGGTFSLTARARIDGVRAVLALPLTFMNVSGSAVKVLVKKHKIELSDILVVVDDLDLEAGRLKIRAAGTSGGHKGIASVIDALGTGEFNRLRLGIGRPPRGVESSEYVLAPFSKKEKADIEEAIENAVACCESWAQVGITETMNIFNKRSKDNE